MELFSDEKPIDVNSYDKTIVERLRLLDDNNLSNYFLIMTIVERIRLYRQQKGLSQAELADKADINNKSLSRYELGTTIPPADALKSIADVLGVSADALLSDEVTSIKDKELYKKFEVIQDMEEEDKAIIIRFLDLTIRDFKTKQAYK